MPYDSAWDHRAALGEETFDPYLREAPSSPLLVREPHKGRYSRGYLPHIDLPLTRFITFRLYGSFLKVLLDRWWEELEALDEEERRRETYRRTESYVDGGHGSCSLRHPEIARIVEDQLRFHDGERYGLLAWTIMPNHVHLLARIREGFSLPKIVQSWKARSARRANERLGRRGAFWYRDYFDRYIRDEAHLANCRNYIDRNPVKAGLCSEASEWAWGSARLTALEGTPSATRRSKEIV